MTDFSNNSNYIYDENVAAAFVQSAGKFLTVDYKVGLRGEFSDVKGDLNSLQQDSTTTQRYFNLFPSVYLGKDLDAKGNHNLSISYNRRISRPSFSSLNPFKYFVDNFSVTSGNPGLKPAYIDAVELGYTLKQKYYVGLTLSTIKDQINQVTEVDSATNILTMIRKNIGSTKTATLNFSAPVKINKWWSSNNNLLLMFKDISSPEFDIQKGTFTLQSNHQFTISPKTSVNLSGFYTPRAIYGNVVSGEYSNVTIGVRQKLLANKLVLSASIYDLFHDNNPKLVSYYNNLQVVRYQNFQTRMLNFSLVYNFKTGKSFKVRETERSNEDEKGRL